MAIAAERSLTGYNNVSTLVRTAPDGSFEEVLFPGGTGKVRELRHEASVTLARRSHRASAYNFRRRRNVATSPGGPEDGRRRRFTRPKGYVVLAWQAGSKLRATPKIERGSGKISFFDFLASRDLSEDRRMRRTRSSCRRKAGTSRRAHRDLAAFGTTTAAVYGQRIEDLVDRIPIGFRVKRP